MATPHTHGTKSTHAYALQKQQNSPTHPATPASTRLGVPCTFKVAKHTQSCVWHTLMLSHPKLLAHWVACCSLQRVVTNSRPTHEARWLLCSCDGTCCCRCCSGGPTVALLACLHAQHAHIAGQVELEPVPQHHLQQSHTHTIRAAHAHT